MDINQLNRAYAEQYFKDHNLKEQYKEAMKQKPVAWIAYDEFGDFMLEPTPDGNYPWQPLYTAPRELSDDLNEALDCLKIAYDETMSYIKLNNLGGENNNWLVKARAILKKASEK